MQLNKTLYLIGFSQIILGLFALVFFMFLAEAIGSDSVMLGFVIFFMISALISLATFMVFIYNIWDAIQSQYTKTTPAKAVGLLFIPLFNIYWFYVVTVDWAKAYNRLIRTAEPHIPKTSEDIPLFLFFGYLVSSFGCLSWLGFILFFVLSIIFISNACDAVNRLAKVSVIPYSSINAHAISLEEDGWSDEPLSQTRKRSPKKEAASAPIVDEWSPEPEPPEPPEPVAEPKRSAKPYQPIADGIKDPWAKDAYKIESVDDWKKSDSDDER
ncbi:MAG: hypothetical protein ABIH86_07250 [Planctomycetota bacterium]